MLSKEFLSKYGKEALNTKIVDYLTYGGNPYMLIEQLAEALCEADSELINIKEMEERRQFVNNSIHLLSDEEINVVCGLIINKKK